MCLSSLGKRDLGNRDWEYNHKQNIEIGLEIWHKIGCLKMGFGQIWVGKPGCYLLK